MILARASGMSAFSFDGRLIAAVSDKGAGVWELASRRQLALLEVLPAKGVTSLAFSPDDQRLVTGFSAGGELQPGLRVWDYQIGRDLLGLYNQGILIGWTEFSPDGNTLLGVSCYGVVNLYRAPSWAEIEAAEKGVQPMSRGRHEADGKHVADEPAGATGSVGLQSSDCLCD